MPKLLAVAILSVAFFTSARAVEVTCENATVPAGATGELLGEPPM
jgi:hypothetical protein